jgi:mannose-6-phosphate isomerase-like protein (cupin superfamily)
MMPLFPKEGAKAVPDWADFSDWGVNHLKKGVYFEPHFHDAHEFVVLISGRLKTVTEGREYFMEAGDALLTKMGEAHDWLVLEDSVSLWACARLQGQKRPGHLGENGPVKH